LCLGQCLFIYIKYKKSHLRSFFLFTWKENIEDPTDDPSPNTLLILVIAILWWRWVIIAEFNFFVLVDIILVLVRVRHYSVFLLVRSHQLFFHNVEVDQVEFLKGAETVSKLEVEVRKLFEVWTLEKVVITIS